MKYSNNTIVTKNKIIIFLNYFAKRKKKTNNFQNHIIITLNKLIILMPYLKINKNKLSIYNQLKKKHINNQDKSLLNRIWN